MKHTIFLIAGIILNMYIIDMQPPNPTPGSAVTIPGTLIVFENPVSVYAYAPGTNIHHADDPRLLDISLYPDLKQFMPVFNEAFEKALQSNRRVITIPYNALIAKLIDIGLHKYFSDVLDTWQLVTFFHDDAATARLPHTNGSSPLDDKQNIILDMLNFPFIKKIEIPYNAVLTQADLLSAFLIKR